MSALKENEAVLDSIEGKIKTFTNAFQTMWNNIIGSDIIKNVVDFGTWIVTIIGDLGLLKTALIAVTAVKILPWILQLTTSFQGYGKTLVSLGKWMTTVQGSNVRLGQSIGNLVNTFKTGGMSVKQFASSLGTLVAKSPITSILAVAAAIGVVIAISEKAITTLAEQQEKFNEATSDLESTKGKLNSLKSELSDIEGQIETLQSKGPLSFTEQEELSRLQSVSAELERQIGLTETLAQQQQKSVNYEATKTINQYDDAVFETGKGKSDYQEQGAKWGAAIGGTLAAIGILLAPFTGGLSAAATVGVTAAAGLAGAGIGAGLGYGVGGEYADNQVQVGEALEDMREQRAKLQEAANKAYQAYVNDPTDEKLSEKYQAASMALDEYDSKMTNHISQMDAYYKSIDFSAYDPILDADKIKGLRQEMNDFYDTQDKWAIMTGTRGAKENALNRIWNSDELKDVKKQIEEAARAGKEIHLEEYFNPTELDAFNQRLYDMGIYTHETEAYFIKAAEAAAQLAKTPLYEASTEADGLAKGVQSITDALKTAKVEGGLTSDALKTLSDTLGGVESLGDSWTNFAEIMSSTTSTIIEQEEAARQLVTTYLDNKLDGVGNLTPEQKGIYISKLDDAGVWNARELVDNQMMQNMYQSMIDNADYDWGYIERTWGEFRKFIDSAGQENTLGMDFVQRLGDLGIEVTKNWEDLASEERNIIADSIDAFKEISAYDVQKIADEYGYELPLYLKLADDADQEVEEALTRFEEGGNVDLHLRPKISLEDMKSAGWDEFDDEYATLFSSVYSNEDGTIAMNFTPILPDGRVLSPGELQQYAEDVIAGVHDDYLKLQIGAEFTGEDAIEQATQAGTIISKLHSEYLTTGTSAEYVAGLINEYGKTSEALNDVKKKQSEYQTWLTGNDANKGYKKLIQDVDAAKEKVDKFKEEFGEFNADDWTQIGNLGLRYKNFDTGEVLSLVEFTEKEKQQEKYQSLIDNYDKLKKELDQKIKEGKTKGFLTEDGELNEEVTVELQAEAEGFQAELDAIKDQLDAFAEPVMVQFSFDVDQVKAEIEATKTAISESMSGTGMTEDSVKNIQSIYTGFANYDEAELFEATANGIHLNADALRRLRDEQDEYNRDKIDSKLTARKAAYEDLTDKIIASSDATEIANYMMEQEVLSEEISELSMLAAAYDGVTSSYQAWVDAQAGPEEGDMYDSVQGSIESMKELYSKGLVGTEEFRTGVAMWTGVDASADIDTIVAAYKQGLPIIQKYFTTGKQGAQAFLQKVSSINSEWAHINQETGDWEINIDNEALATELGVSVEMVEAIQKKLKDYGFEVHFGDLFEELKGIDDQLEQYAKDLELEVHFKATDMDVLDADIEKAKEKLDTFKDPKTGQINLQVDGAEQAQMVLTALLVQKQKVEQEGYLKFNIEDPQTKIESLVVLLDQIQSTQQKIDIAVAVGQDTTELDSQMNGLIEELGAQEIPGELKIDPTKTGSEIAEAWTTFKSNNAESGKLMVDLGINKDAIINYNPDEADPKTGTVTYDYNDEKIQKYKPPNKTGYVTWKSKNTTIATNFVGHGTVYLKAEAAARGTAFATGTAFAQGNWGTKRSGIALGGELGPELVVFTMPPYIVIYM